MNQNMTTFHSWTSPGPSFCGWSQTVKDRLWRSGNTVGSLEDSFFEVVRIFLAQEMGICCCLIEWARSEGSWIARIYHVWASWWLPHAGRAEPVLGGTPAKVSERLELLYEARQFLKNGTVELFKVMWSCYIEVSSFLHIHSKIKVTIAMVKISQVLRAVDIAGSIWL